MIRSSYTILVKATLLVVSLALSHLAYSQTSTAGSSGWCVYKDAAIGWDYKEAEASWCWTKSHGTFYFSQTKAFNNWQRVKAGGSVSSLQSDTTSVKAGGSHAQSFLQRYTKRLWNNTGPVLNTFGLSEHDLDRFLDERATIVYGVLVFAIFLIVFGFIRWVSFLRAKGQEYGLNLFASLQFFLILAGPILFVVFSADCGGIYVETNDGRVCQQSDEEFSLVLQNAGWIYLGLVVVAFLINFIKSNLLFAVSFTFVQIVLSWLIILVVIMIWLWWKQRKGRLRA